MCKRLNTNARTAMILALIAGALAARPAEADENGVSFWLPGIYGTLAAVPTPPGFSFTTFNYYDSVSSVSNISLGGGEHVVTGVNARADLQYVYPSYTFATPVPGGFVTVGVVAFAGDNTTSEYQTVFGPGGPLLATQRSSTLFAAGDLAPYASFKWGVPGPNYFMTYVAGLIPVGSYEVGRLNVFGIGHGAFDGGAGYSYFKDGNGFSAVAGLTYNFINPSTQYRNGVDAHLDWSALHFLTPNVFFGAVGYVYDQLTADSGSGAKLAAFESRVIGVGPQLGFVFPVGGMMGYVTFKAYDEFDARNRASGYNLWAMFSITPAWPAAPPPQPVVAKY
jgi:hypothetical protein